MGWKDRPMDYQWEAVNQTKEAFRKGKKAVLDVMATGGGKTDVIALGTKLASLKGTKVGVAVHREEILLQIVERMEEHYELSPGIIMSGYPMNPKKQVQVVSTDTFIHRSDFFKPQLWWCDEAHHFVPENKTYSFMLDAPFLAGVTATPERPDGTDLSGVFDCLIHPITTQELIKRGRIVDVEVYYPLGGPDLSKVRGGKEYSQKALWEKFNDEGIFKKAVDEYKDKASGLQGICYCVNVQHAEIMAQVFNANGVTAAVLHGKLDKDVRRKIIERYRAGKIMMLTNFGIVSEGFDVPECDVTLFLTKTKSKVKWYQGIGRCMRSRPGKTHGIVIDLGGNILQKQFTIPKLYDINGFDLVKPQKPKLPPTMKICPSCRVAVLASTMKCPDCGHVFPPPKKKFTYDISRIPMVKLKEYKAFEMSIRYKKSPSLARSPISHLRSIARIKGYKQGWVMKVLQNRGLLPKGFRDYKAMNGILIQAEQRDGVQGMYLYFKSREVE